jgi:hypothetical protein
MPMQDKGTDKRFSLAANVDNARFDGRQDNRPIKRSRVLHVRAPRIANERRRKRKTRANEMKTAAWRMFWYEEVLSENISTHLPLPHARNCCNKGVSVVLRWLHEATIVKTTDATCLNATAFDVRIFVTYAKRRRRRGMKLARFATRATEPT